ncbi:MAG: hypothetical protein ACR2IA_03600, partial [Pyrinomonadaceae bacterium]
MNLSFSTFPKIFQYLKICLWFVNLSAVFFGQSAIKNDFPAQSCFQFPLPKGSVISQIASDNIYHFPLVTNDKFLNSIDLTTGKINWSFDVGGTIAKRNLVSSEFTFLANTVKKNVINTDSNDSDENKLVIRSINNYSGLVVWKTETKIEFPSLITNNLSPDQTGIYELKDTLLVRSDYCFIRVNKIDGTIIWKKCIEPNSTNTNNTNNADDRTDFDSNDVNLNISGDILAFSDHKYIYLLMLQTGEVFSKIKSEIEITAIVPIGRSNVIYGNKKGIIRSLNTDSKKVFWSVK